MKVNINRLDKDFYLEATNEEGKSVYMDAAETIGGSNKAARPMQLLLMALGGCSAFDIIHILRKYRVQLDDINIEVNGEREPVKDLAAVFKDISIVFKLTGDIPADTAIKAVTMSLEKYCSVSKTLEQTAVISYAIILNGTKIHEGQSN